MVRWNPMSSPQNWLFRINCQQNLARDLENSEDLSSSLLRWMPSTESRRPRKCKDQRTSMKLSVVKVLAQYELWKPNVNFIKFKSHGKLEYSQNRQNDFLITVTCKICLRLRTSPNPPKPNPQINLASGGIEEKYPAFDNLNSRTSVINSGAAVCRK